MYTEFPRLSAYSLPCSLQWDYNYGICDSHILSLNRVCLAQGRLGFHPVLFSFHQFRVECLIVFVKDEHCVGCLGGIQFARSLLSPHTELILCNL